MKKNMQWKLLAIVGVIILSLYLSYPPNEKIHYGLDLQGGMHLVLQVITDDAINAETDQEILRLQEQLKKQNITYDSISKSDNQIGRFTVQNFDPEKEGQIRKILEDYFKEWTPSFSGSVATLTLKSDVSFYLRDQSVRQSEETLWNRVDELGLTEPTIQRQGGPTGDRIIVELPGVEDPERVKNIIKTTAKLEWKMVMGGPAMTEEALLEPHGGNVPEGMEIVKGDPKRTEGGYYLLSRVATVTGKDLRMARRTVDEWNNPAVSFTLNPEGGRRFAQTTGEHVGENLAIVLDGRVQSAPRIDEKISGGSGIIHGRYTLEEADDMALVLRAGAMPAEVKYLEERTIGPSLGADSIRKGIISIVSALVLILIFMVLYYKLAGVNAITALILNILILAAALAYFRANLTVPGIAGIILTIGMAVDANVLVFERIREELAQGKSVLSSVAAGFSRAFRTILDANVTTIIAAVFLFQFGTGPIRGFAFTLIIGITASMFTAIFVSRFIFDATLSKKKKGAKLSI